MNCPGIGIEYLGEVRNQSSKCALPVTKLRSGLTDPPFGLYWQLPRVGGKAFDGRYCPRGGHARSCGFQRVAFSEPPRKTGLRSGPMSSMTMPKPQPQPGLAQFLCMSIISCG
eukprot:Amastigsp_a206_482.p3 type:complete len:113 gc:universal Amastigsp_a206_482:474-136(-)